MTNRFKDDVSKSTKMYQRKILINLIEINTTFSE